jgi:hypothetical protein
MRQPAIFNHRLALSIALMGIAFLLGRTIRHADSAPGRTPLSTERPIIAERRERHLNEDQNGGLVNSLRAFAHQEFWIVVEDGGPAAVPEEVGFSRELGGALNSAHWIKSQKIWQRMGAAGFQQVQMQDSSRGGDSGIVIFAPAASASAGEALNRELRRLSMRSSIERDENLKDSILIFVGPP